MKSISIAEITGECSGCGACYSVCKRKAVEIKINKDGFYSATVDENRCIKCGLCTKVCMKKVMRTVDPDSQYVYAVQSQSKSVLDISTSGGAVFHLSESWLEQPESAVSGVTYDKNKSAVYMEIDDIKDYYLISGSKYLQANFSEHINYIIEKLKSNSDAKQLIVGTPCQIYGISRALKLQGLRKQVCCIELFCHGVPSMNLWKKYLQEYEKQNRNILSNVQFRSKKYGWHMYTLKMEGKSKCNYMTSDQSAFYDIFFDKVALNKSCFNCPFFKVSGEADIKVGDFWGPRFSDDDKGVSALIVMTEEGRKLFDKTKNQLSILGKYNIGEVLQYQSKRPYKVDNKVVESVYEQLNSEKNLETIRKEYRRTFSVKMQIRLILKTVYSKFPIFIRKNAKKRLSKIRK